MLFYSLLTWTKCRVMVMAFNVTFNNISVISRQSVLLVEETEIHRKPLTCRKSLLNFITSSCIEYTSLWARFELNEILLLNWMRYHDVLLHLLFKWRFYLFILGRKWTRWTWGSQRSIWTTSKFICRYG
jgi:hypothetical protein